MIDDDKRQHRLTVLCPFGAGSAYNGPTVLMNRLFSALRNEKGWNITLLYADSEEPIQDWDYAFRLAGRPKNQWSRVHQVIWALSSALHILRNRARIDSVHFQGVYVENLIPGLFCKLLGIPATYLPVLEGGDLRSNRTVGLGMLLTFARRIMIASRSSIGLALSPGIARELSQNGFQKIQTIGNPVSPEFFDHPPRTESKLTLLFIGKIGKRKRPDLMLGALSALSEELDVRASFIGPFESPEYEEYFLGEANRLKVENLIRISGHVMNVASHLSWPSIFVLLSEAEGMPGALAEAMAAGIPCVVTDVGAMAHEVVEAEAGEVVQPSVDHLIFAIKRIAAPDTYDALSANATAFARNKYSLRAVTGVYIKALESALPGGTS